MSKECCCDTDPVDKLYYPVELCASDDGAPPLTCENLIFATQEVCNWCTETGNLVFYKPCDSGCCVWFAENAIATIPESQLPVGACKLETTPVPNVIGSCWDCCSNATNCVPPLLACGICGNCASDNTSCGEGQACAETYVATFTTPQVPVYMDYEFTVNNDPNCCVAYFPSISASVTVTRFETNNCAWHTDGYVPVSVPGSHTFSHPLEAGSFHSCATTSCAQWNGHDCGLPCPCCTSFPIEDFAVSISVYRPTDFFWCTPTPCSLWGVSVSVSCSTDSSYCPFPIIASGLVVSAAYTVSWAGCNCPSQGSLNGEHAIYPAAGVNATYCPTLVAMGAEIGGLVNWSSVYQKHNVLDFERGVELQLS